LVGAAILLLVFLAGIVAASLSAEGRSIVSHWSTARADNFWPALYAGALATLLTGVITGAVAGAWVGWESAKIQDRREDWEAERSVRVAAYRVLERLSTISRTARNVTSVANDTSTEDVYRLLNHEKWWLGGDLDAYRDAVNLYRDMSEIQLIQDSLGLQRRIRSDLLIQPELRSDNLAAYRMKLDPYVYELSVLLGENPTKNYRDDEAVDDSWRLAHLHGDDGSPQGPRAPNPG
jgi:hypothetical protein